MIRFKAIRNKEKVNLLLIATLAAVACFLLILSK